MENNYLKDSQDSSKNISVNPYHQAPKKVLNTTVKNNPRKEQFIRSNLNNNEWA